MPTDLLLLYPVLADAVLLAAVWHLLTSLEISKWLISPEGFTGQLAAGVLGPGCAAVV